LKTKKITDICVVLQKMTFNKSHLNLCMVTRRHSNTIKMFLRGSWVASARARGQLCSCPLLPLPLAPPMYTIWWTLFVNVC